MGGDVTGEILEFDSEWFGMKVGRYDDDPAAADRWANETGIDLLYTLLPLTHVKRFDQRLGFRVVDVRVEMTLDLATRPRLGAALQPQLSVQLAQPDFAGVSDLALTAFRGSRFFNDRKLKATRVGAMYQNWLASSHVVYVAVMGGEPVGFATLDGNDLGLIAVREGRRRRGIGSALLVWAANRAADDGATEMRAVTQGGNVAAQRLFQSQGFRTTYTGLWLHKHYGRTS